MSIHRIGIAVAAIVTVAGVGGAFVVQGYVSAEQASAQAAATAQAVAQATANSPQIVYVNPPLPTPATTDPTLPPPPVIHVIVPGGYGDDDGGGGGDR